MVQQRQVEPVTPDQQRIVLVPPGSFEPARHFYERVRNAHLHPLVRYFLSLGNERIATRYCHLHPEVEGRAVYDLLADEPRFFRWAGCDLFHVTDDRGSRGIVVIETNSCPSGQKSVPLLQEEQEQAGYRELLRRAFVPLLERKTLPAGVLAVLWDKNPMEASGYAASLASLVGETVYLVPCFDGDSERFVRVVDGVLQIQLGTTWTPVKAAFRYVTQRPWNRLPALTSTLIFNPVIACLAGGRNKQLAARAYEDLNQSLQGTGLSLAMPETMQDVRKEQVPELVERLGGYAVVKVPYANAGQGVYTIASPVELAEFMSKDYPYDRFIVQALIGNIGWSSHSPTHGTLYHLGTIPNARGEIFAADLRFMVGAGTEGFFPIALYARRARLPLAANVADASSWEMLGTNLSVKTGQHQWSSEHERLLMMDSREFNVLGLGLDDLIEAYVQTVLAVTAIDRMASQLVEPGRRFKRARFAELTPDPALVQEIRD